MFRSVFRATTTILKASHRHATTAAVRLENVLKEAEKLVKVPSFQALSSDIDFTNVGFINTTNEHPITDIFKRVFIPDDESSINATNHIGGMVLLLVAKAAETMPNYKSSDEIIEKQQQFAEIYEHIDKALYIHHDAVLNLEPSEDSYSKSLNTGNKVSILIGDYLFSVAIVRMANAIQNSQILELLGAAIDEYCINQFNIKRDSKGNILPWRSISILDWEDLGGYCSAKLLAYSCQAMMHIANLSTRNQKAAYDFGHNLQLIWNLKNDLHAFSDTNSHKPNLISAPVILHLEHDPKFYNYLMTMSDALDKSMIVQKIKQGPALNKCEELLNFYANKANKALSVFPESEAKDSLKNIILAMPH